MVIYIYIYIYSCMCVYIYIYKLLQRSSLGALGYRMVYLYKDYESNTTVDDINPA